MGRLFVMHLEGKVYSCKHCHTHLGLATDIISKEAAHEKSQRYKEGKFILERYKVSGPDGSHYWVTHDAQVGGSDVDDV
uniref:Yippee domain-containing protein n=1 Tax=Leersia perrieri TaxID=77586 RepID=A0A0D9VXT7_9ORYZ